MAWWYEVTNRERSYKGTKVDEIRLVNIKITSGRPVNRDRKYALLERRPHLKPKSLAQRGTPKIPESRDANLYRKSSQSFWN